MNNAPRGYMVVSTNFDLEPVLKAYMETYPNGDYSSFRIVYEGQNEMPDTPHSYIVVFDSRTGNGMLLWNYLQAWCKINRGKRVVTDKLIEPFPAIKEFPKFHTGEIL